MIYKKQNQKFGGIDMKDKIFTLRVLNTFTNSYEDVEVTQEIYITALRDEWNIKNSDKRFYKHEIQVSCLIGAEDGKSSDFKEFVSDENNPEKICIENENEVLLKRAFTALSKEEQELVIALYFNGKAEREYSNETGMPQKTINNRKHRIVNKLKTLMKN
jgi:RNA polymerase sigma factor (sigma-70 family)